MTTPATTGRRVQRLVLAALCAALLLVAGPAWAHVTAVPGSAPAGKQVVVSFRVGHACDGSPTTAISVRLPDRVASVTPQFLPGWEVETTNGPLAEPVEVHGETVTEGIREITWSGGSIPDHTYFDFGVSMLLPDRPGKTLYFPVVQTCESGETAWIEVPAKGEDAHDLELPAPSVTLSDGDTADADHGAESETADEEHSETAAASEPVATAELATSQEPPSTLVPVVLAVVGAALAAGLVAWLVTRRRPS
ncbi:MAG TPA: YcnI family protein [Euzebyales bacterium]|nr:YcnI family protein [Euzebyales bacterium]